MTVFIFSFYPLHLPKNTNMFRGKSITEQVQHHPGSAEHLQREQQQRSSVSLRPSSCCCHTNEQLSSTAQTASRASPLSETHPSGFLGLVCTTALQTDYSLLFICLVGRVYEGGVSCLCSTWPLPKHRQQGQQCFQLPLPTFPHPGKETGRQRCISVSARFTCRWEQVESNSERLTHQCHCQAGTNPSTNHNITRLPSLYMKPLPQNLF